MIRDNEDRPITIFKDLPYKEEYKFDIRIRELADEDLVTKSDEIDNALDTIGELSETISYALFSIGMVDGPVADPIDAGAAIAGAIKRFTDINIPAKEDDLYIDKNG